MVRFVNCFEIPAGREEEFFLLWQEVNTYLGAKPGYLGHRLHRSLTADARFRYVNYVNYVEWESAEHWRRAHDEGFRALVSRTEWTPFASTPALYDVVHEGGSMR